MVVIYITLIVAEGNNSFFEVLPWGLLMLIAAAGAFSSTQIEDRRVARIAMFWSAGLFVILGVLSGFTIGLGFLVAAALLILATTKLSDIDQ
jgi:hypothetical protein